MLYHISIRFWEDIKEFIPRIPNNCAQDFNEDTTIPRIYLSDSLDGCLTAAGWGNYNLIKDPVYKVDDFIVIGRVYKFDTKDINKNHLLGPEKILKYVPDAEITNEHWVIKQKLKPADSNVFILRNFCFDPIVFSHNDKKFISYKIANPIYNILTRQQEKLLVNYVNSKDKDIFIKKYGDRLSDILSRQHRSATL